MIRVRDDIYTIKSQHRHFYNSFLNVWIKYFQLIATYKRGVIRIGRGFSQFIYNRGDKYLMTESKSINGSFDSFIDSFVHWIIETISLKESTSVWCRPRGVRVTHISHIRRSPRPLVVSQLPPAYSAWCCEYTKIRVDFQGRWTSLPSLGRPGERRNVRFVPQISI